MNIKSIGIACIILTILSVLGGCTSLVYGPFAESQAKAKMDESRKALDSCLSENQDYPGLCDNEKRAYEYNKKKWMEIRAGWT